VITTTVIPPPILQYYRRCLLQTPILKQFKAQELLEIYKFILRSITKIKYSKYPATIDKILEKHTTFMELYGEAIEKEKEAKDQQTHAAKRLFYRPELPNKDDARVFERLRQRSKTSSLNRKNRALHKV